jgi:hypothetical protein
MNTDFATMIYEVSYRYEFTLQEYTFIGSESAPKYGVSLFISTQVNPGRKVNILGGHSIGHSKQNDVYICILVSYPERFPR